MSRKNIFGLSDVAVDEEEPASNLRDKRPIAGLIPPVRAAAPVGGISKTLGNITSKSSVSRHWSARSRKATACSSWIRL
jgi:ParB family chromosome partitioning protein